MIVLGIETTCDETAASVVESGRRILSNVVASQRVHASYGGVFPELASRRHIEILIPLIDEALKRASVTREELDVIAVAYGPGLMGSLLVGLNTAKSLSLAWNIPFVGVNHVEAHLYAAMMGQPSSVLLPALGVVLSGGHTFLTEISALGSYRLLGTTVDDAIGEAFDKTAVLLGLSYPGGADIEKLSLSGNPQKYPFSSGKVKRSPLDFSFSGLKTAVLYQVNRQKKEFGSLSEEERCDIAASFQHTAFWDVIRKSLLAASTFACKAIFLGGGVAQNQYLQNLFAKEAPHLPLFFPPKELCSDNAAMIAGLGYHKFVSHRSGSPFSLEAAPRISFH